MSSVFPVDVTRMPVMGGFETLGPVALGQGGPGLRQTKSLTALGNEPTPSRSGPRA